MNKRYNLNLTTLSPIHIGNDEVLSPYSDYIFKDGYIYYIDSGKLGDFFKEQPNFDELMDEYIEIINIQASTNLQGKQNIEHFFEKHGLDIESFSRSKIKADIRITQFINQTTNSCGNPYIPGSTLKGAIRTGILYNHIYEEKLKPKGRSPYIGQDVFGSFAKDKFKYLSISDTNLIDKNNMKIAKTVRYNLDKKKEDMPVIFEVIKANSSLDFSINLKGDLDSRFDYLNTGNIKKILSMLNEFYLQCIEREIKEIQRNINSEVYCIIDFYNELKKDILSIKNENNEAIIRIGAGKTFFENTIGLALEKNELERIIVKDNARSKIKRNKHFFPKTRTFCVSHGKYDQVLGWARIGLQE